MDRKAAHVLIGMADGQNRESLAEMIRSLCPAKIAAFSHFEELESAACCLAPEIIVMSDEILAPNRSLAGAARRLTAIAPLVVRASPERQTELAGFVISGELDVVAPSPDFAAVAAALVERRLHLTESYSREFRSAWTADLPSDFAEVLRHEINNPLTGILGNAELLLSQLRGKVPPVSLQRLETVIDLAVRLREKVRCLAAESNRDESSVQTL